MRLVKYLNVKPGMVCEDRYHPGKVVKKILVIKCPGYQYDLVRVVFTDGSMTPPKTAVFKMSVR